MGQIIIAKLDATGRDSVGRFRLDDDAHFDLKNFIRNNARRSAENLSTQTYVAKRVSDNRVIGFVSLMCAEVRLDQAITGSRRELQPALRVAQLAIEDDSRGQYVGRDLLRWSMGVALDIQPRAGCRFLILDAKQGSISFYAHHGFRLIDTEENLGRPQPTMFLDMKPHI